MPWLYCWIKRLARLALVVLLSLLASSEGQSTEQKQCPHAHWLKTPDFSLEFRGNDVPFWTEPRSTYTQFLTAVVNKFREATPEKIVIPYFKDSKFNQGRIIIHVDFAPTDAFETTLDSQEGSQEWPRWVFEALEYSKSSFSCDAAFIGNYYSPNLIFSAHTNIIALNLDKKTIVQHLRCIASAFGVCPETVAIDDNLTIPEAIDKFYTAVEKVSWGLK
ncbi:MAG TPA: hypothetical protein VHL08_02745 [Dongiaceae bacterium]|jgi:hypothetical protein|nr:hypothetical protein [Dongiaceae bacterium]